MASVGNAIVPFVAPARPPAEAAGSRSPREEFGLLVDSALRGGQASATASATSPDERADRPDPDDSQARSPERSSAPATERETKPAGAKPSDPSVDGHAPESQTVAGDAVLLDVLAMVMLLLGAPARSVPPASPPPTPEPTTTGTRVEAQGTTAPVPSPAPATAEAGAAPPTGAAAAPAASDSLGSRAPNAAATKPNDQMPAPAVLVAAGAPAETEIVRLRAGDALARVQPAALPAPAETAPTAAAPVASPRTDTPAAQTRGANAPATPSTAVPLTVLASSSARTGENRSGVTGDGRDGGGRNDPVPGLTAAAPTPLPRSAVPTPPAPLPEAPPGVSGAVVERVLDRVRDALSLGQASVRVRLEPEWLGPVDVRIVARHGVLGVRMIAATPETRDALQGGIERLRQGLAEGGFQISRIHVEMPAGQTPASAGGFGDAPGQAPSQGRGDDGADGGWRQSFRLRAALDGSVPEPPAPVAESPPASPSRAIDYRA